ncbi:hypothetical protein ACJX0J_007225 [Zea mays]
MAAEFLLIGSGLATHLGASRIDLNNGWIKSNFFWNSENSGIELTLVSCISQSMGLWKKIFILNSTLVVGSDVDGTLDMFCALWIFQNTLNISLSKSRFGTLC